MASGPSDTWPSESEAELSILHRSGTIFLYAATAIRYIDDEDGNYMVVFL